MGISYPSPLSPSLVPPAYLALCTAPDTFDAVHSPLSGLKSRLVTLDEFVVMMHMVRVVRLGNAVPGAVPSVLQSILSERALHQLSSGSRSQGRSSRGPIASASREGAMARAPRPLLVESVADPKTFSSSILSRACGKTRRTLGFTTSRRSCTTATRRDHSSSSTGPAASSFGSATKHTCSHA